MNCRDLEQRLERLAGGELPGREREACERHAAECEDCAELLRLATLPLAPADLAPAVFAATASGCDRARELIAASFDEDVAPVDEALLAEHETGCSGCAALHAVVESLAAELPRLAVLRPDDQFVDDVLRATLPVPVRLRRWWRQAWPRWVHRPRFASEAAYIGVLVLAIVFGSTGTPLAAVPERAVELTRASTDQGWTRIESTVRESVVAADLRAAAQHRVGQARDLVDDAGNRLGTLWTSAASLLKNADEPPSSEPNDPTEATP